MAGQPDPVGLVRDYYATGFEEGTRLASTPQFRLEARRTRTLLEQRLPPR